MGKALEISRLCVGYPRRQVIDDLSLPALACGTITAVVGPNAAGKTTLLRALAGLLPAGGEARYDGGNILKLKPAQRARLVTYMPQALPQGVALTVIEAVMTALRVSSAGRDASGRTIQACAGAVLDRLGIGHLEMSAIDELSGGQRQLVSLAQAIVRRPAILLLDEPTSALDPAHQIGVMAAVKDHVASDGAVAMVVLHDLNLALRWADTVVLLTEGGVRAVGRAEDALTSAVLSDAYGVVARVEQSSLGRPYVLFDRIVGP
ncbi:MAG: ABC transporter ATP-binding protein [Thalassobaculaceae bacterium]|nr:ABC transporter ATP-binding protein [Thalassobaculaceae bacterium]